MAEPHAPSPEPLQYTDYTRAAEAAATRRALRELTDRMGELLDPFLSGERALDRFRTNALLRLCRFTVRRLRELTDP